MQTPTPPEPRDGPATTPATLPDGLFARMRSDPTHAPEHLALAAVERFGPEARDWADRFRAEHPAVPVPNAAQLVRTQFVRLSRYSGALAGVTGALGAVVDTGVLAWNQARMVLYLAAVYGQDPTDPERAVELLMLRDIHRKVSAARTALDVAARRQQPGALLDQMHSDRDGSLLVLGWELAKMAGMRALRRAVLKVVPLASVPLGAMANASSTKKLANRAIAMYAPRWHGGQAQLPPGAAPSG